MEETKEPRENLAVMNAEVKLVAVVVTVVAVVAVTVEGKEEEVFI